MTTVDQVRERAVRRASRTWYWYPAVLTAIVGTGALLGGTLFDAITTAAPALAVSVGIARSRMRALRDGAPPNVQLRHGLRWRERRAVRRDIWRGEPSLDATLRSVEVTDAAMIARVYGWLVLGALGGATVILSFINADYVTMRTQLADVVVSAAFIGVGFWCLVWWISARRFLAPLRRATR